MSRLRPELTTATGPHFTLKGVEAYLTILKAVEQHPKGLVHGKLHWKGESCAIGCYFDMNSPCLPETLVDEVAAINDSVPTYSMQKRRTYVMQWLRWKLRQLGMPQVGRPGRNPQEAK